MMKAKRKKEKHFFTDAKKTAIIFIGSAIVVGLFFLFTRTVDFFIHRYTARTSSGDFLPIDDFSNKSEKTRDTFPSEGSVSKLTFWNTLFQKEDKRKYFNIREKNSNETKRLQNNITNPSSVQKEIEKPFLFNVVYAIQLGSFKNREGAKSFMRSLNEKGYHPYLVIKNIPGKGSLYRVRIGKFKDLALAQKKASEIEKKERITVLITSR